jgi:N-acetylglucosamine-6-sulfatase
MRGPWVSIGILWGLVAGAMGGFTGQAQAGQAPCQKIIAACEGAGYVKGGTTAGRRLWPDCVRPIMQETGPRAPTGLPSLDPQLIAECRAKNPTFGQQAASAAATPPASSGTTAPVAPLPTHPPRAGAPNIVFVLTDDLSWNLVSYMPHVLQMQKEGATFTNYFVTDSLCCPSRSSIFTGRYPHDTGVYTNTGKDGGYLAFLNHGNEHATFATALHAAGYRTAMLGKYLNGYLPDKHPPAPGWTSWAVAGNGYPEYRYELNQDGKFSRRGNAPEDYLTDVLSGIATGFIRQSAGAPFVIEIATFAPHAPYVPAPRDADAFPNLHAPRTQAFDAAPDATAPRWLKEVPPLSDKEMANIDADFRKRAQSVQAVDAMIGALQAAVAARGEAGNTYFIFSSDNGYHMGEYRLRPGKMTPYDTDVRVPLIVTGPGVPPGRTIEAITENIDLNPTFAELAGEPIAAGVDGHSLLALLAGKAAGPWRSVALVEHHGPHQDPSDPDAPAAHSGNPTTYEAIRSPDALYVEYADGEHEYHDLAADPAELNNTFSLLSGSQRQSLHATLMAMENCHNAQACWAAALAR